MKTTIVFSIDNLKAAGIPITYSHVAPQRNRNVYFKNKGINVQLKCKYEAATPDLLFWNVENEEFGNTVEAMLRQFPGVDYQREERVPSHFSVSVLELLDRGWLIYQCTDGLHLGIRNERLEFFLSWSNDGENLRATHSMRAHDAEDAAILINALNESNTRYELEYV